MANPVDSFMRGFAVVDQLETNRMNRDFMKAQRSRMYEMWEREDEEYEQAKLKQYQQEKLVEFDYELKNVINSVAEEANRLEETDPEAAANLRNKWFTPNTFTDGEFRGVSLAVQEVVKKMQQRDPSFGEHVALAGGRDPGAGSLVDSKNPVANVMIVPPDASPNGQASVAFELNRKDGQMGPMTVNRTSAGNDPIDFVPIDTQMMFKIFGPGFANNDLAAARMLRGMWEGNDRGNPRAVEKQDATAPAGGGGKEQAAPPEERPSTIMRPEDEQMGLLEKEIVDMTDLTSQERKDLLAETKPEVYGDQPQPSEMERQFSNTIEEWNNIDAAIERAGEDPSAYNIGQAVMMFGTAGARLAQAVGKDAWDALGRAGGPGGVLDSRRGTNFIKGFIGVQPVAKRQATSGKDVTDTGNKPGDFTQDKVANDPEGAMDKAPVADSDQTTQAMAQNVQQTRRRPTIPQLMNAASLAKMNVISPEQLSRYARTGSWDEPAKASMQTVGNGTVAVLEPGSNVPKFYSAPGAGGGAELATTKDQQANLNFYQDRYGGYFEDDERGLAMYTTAVDAALEFLGIPGNTKQDLAMRAHPTVHTLIGEGTKMILNFDEDLVQTFDLPWPFDPDFQVPMNGGNLAVATELARFGVVGARDGTHALREYLERAAPVAGSPQNLLNQVREKEATIKKLSDRAATGQRSTVVIGNQKVVIEPGMSRNDIREEVIEAYVKSIEG
jgi:hypothetical protein